MVARQNRALDSDLRFADRWELPTMMPMFLWIIDGEKAVFAIPSFGGELSEFGFITEELGLVKALCSVWARYVEAANKVGVTPVSTPSLLRRNRA